MLGYAWEGRRGFWPASVERVDLIFLVLFVNKFDVVSIIDQAKVNEVAFSHEIAIKGSTPDWPKLIFLLPLCHQHKVRLELGDHCANCGKKWRNDFLITIPRVDGLACFTHDQEMLFKLVELGQLLVDFNIVLQCWIDLAALKKCLNALCFRKRLFLLNLWVRFHHHFGRFGLFLNWLLGGWRVYHCLLLLYGGFLLIFWESLRLFLRAFKVAIIIDHFLRCRYLLLHFLFLFGLFT